MQGIQSLGPGVAEKMAAMGRYDDDQIAHVAEGEVIVPAPILKYYPEIKEQVFAAIKQEGLNPEEFIVGGEMVAINPRTGVQEFGWLSKTFKKLKKIVKKAAPLLLAVALPMAAPAIFGAGTVASAALTGAAAGGIGSLVQGNSLEDSLKAAAVGATIGGVTAGVSGKPMTAAGKPAPVATPSAPGSASTASTTAGTSTAAAGKAHADVIKAGMDGSAASTTGGVQVADASSVSGTMTDAVQPGTMPSYAPANQVTQQTIPGTSSTAAATSTSGGIADLGMTMSDIPNSASLYPSPTEIVLPGGGPRIGPTVQAAKAGTLVPPPPEPGFFQNVASEFKQNPIGSTTGTLSGASILYGLAGGGGEPQQEDTSVSREDMIQMMGGQEFQNYQGRVASGIFYNPETQQFQDVPYAANSGIVTAAAGGHINGPGTGTSDSIPAYLSDGEFVMTADAVKGAGNGDRQKGAAAMYAMMNKFEGQA
jgi:hypothetical protein